MSHKCIICAGQTYDKPDNKGRIFHFCNSCGFISLDSLSILSETEEKARYDLHNNSSENQGYIRWLNQFIQEAVHPYVYPGDSILDFGSGPDPQLKKLLEFEGYTVDIYDKYFHNLPIPGDYNMITLTEVLEHLKDPLKILSELRKSLRVNGYLAIKTAFSPESDDDFLKWWYKEDSTHISFFSSRTFDLIADKIRLKFHYCDNNSIVIFRN
jgi:ubiquinone/menaquinone biosynthesis C-methylase UbiE